MAEQKLDEKEKLELLLCDCHHLSTEKTINIQRSKMSVQKFVDIAKKDMGLTKTIKIYRENGVELTSSNLYRICNNDTLYVSNGKRLDESLESISLCVMGAGAVGKSAITLRFIQGHFVENYDPTIEDAYRKQVDVDGNQLLIDILDTAGQEDFECLRTQWMKDKDAFVLVFSIVRQASLTKLKDYYDGIAEVYDDGNAEVPPIILVGNKVDLDKNHIAHISEETDVTHNYCDSQENGQQETPERKVTMEEAVEFGKKIGVVHYVETSAKSGYNVENMIGKIVRHLVNRKYRSDQRKYGRKTTTVETTKWWAKCQIL